MPAHTAARSGYHGLRTAMNGLVESIEAALPEIKRDPLSRQSSDAMAQLVERIDEFLSGPILRGAPRLNAAQRAEVTRHAQRASDILRDILSVAEQLDDLGRGRAPWQTALTNALGRFESTLRRRGILVSRSTKRATPIVAKVSTAANAPFLVATVTRRQELEPYIARALRGVKPRKLEGRWYADLEAFPGVWADGSSPGECLATLADVLHEWLLVKIAHRDRDIPVIDHIDPATLLRG